MKSVYSLIITTLILLSLIGAVSADTWLSGWNYRIPIEITNTGVNLTDYQYSFTLDTELTVSEGKMKSDGSDFRVIDSSGSLQPFWNETPFNTNSTKIWVNASVLGNTSDTIHYLYYGNLVATDVSSGDDTFIQWHGAATSNFRDTTIQSIPFIYECSARVIGAGAEVYFGVSNNDTPYLDDTCYVVPNTTANLVYSYAHNEGAGSFDSSAPVWTNNTYYHPVIKAIASNDIKYYPYGDATEDQTTTNSPDEDMGLMMYELSGSGEQEWSFIRKYTPTEPTTNIRGEQQKSDWLPGYKYRTPININNTGNTLNAYQYNITLDTASLISSGKMKSDGSDFRVAYHFDDIVELQPYWNETDFNSASTEIWIKGLELGNSSDTIHYLYYGNPCAICGSSGTNVFIVFDDFEDALQGDWTTLSGTVTYNDTDHAYSGTQSMKISASSRTEIPVTVGDIAIRFRLWKKDASVCYLHHSDGSWDAHISFEADEDIAYYDTAWRDTSDNIIPDQWELMELNDFDWTGHAYDIIRNDVSSYNDAGMWNYNRHTNKVELQNDVGDIIYIDDFIVKKYTSTEPTTSFGSQESSLTLYYNSTSPYNNTICSNSAVSLNHTRLSVDNIYWSSASISDLSYLVFTEFNLSNTVTAEFTTTNTIDWINCSNLTSGHTYVLEYSNGTDIEYHTASSSVNFTTNLESCDYRVKDISIGTPITLTNSTGNFWVRYDWAPNGTGTLTDSYNVSQNSSWDNNTLVTNINDSVGPHGYSDVIIHAYNSSYDITSIGYLSDNVTVPNNIPTDPTNLEDLGIHVIDHTPTVNWTKGTDTDGDTVTTYVYVGTNSTPTDVENSTVGEISELGNVITLSDGITYYYRLRSYDGYVYGNYTTASMFRMNTVPTPSGLTDLGQHVIDHTPTVSWTVTDPEGDTLTTYVYVGNAPNPITEEGNTLTTTYDLGTVVPLSNGNTYYYRLRCHDTYEWGTYTSDVQFRMNSPPAIPTAFTNLGQHVIDHTPTITWTKGTDPEGDTVTTYAYVGSAPDPLTEESHTNAETMDLGTTVALSDGLTYYYRLRSYDGYEYSTSFTANDEFRMNSPPNPPTGYTDLGMNVIDHTPPISWTIGSDPEGDTVTTYVYVGSAPSPVTEETNTLNNHTNLGTTVVLSDGNTYYYRLRSHDSYEWGVYTSDDQFRMNTPPPTPTLNSPANGALLDYSPITLVSNSVSDAEGDTVQYLFYVDKVAATTLIQTSTSTSCGVSPERYKVYYWKVRTYDGYEYSPGYSSIWNFTYMEDPRVNQTLQTLRDNFFKGISIAALLPLAISAAMIIGGFITAAMYMKHKDDPYYKHKGISGHFIIKSLMLITIAGILLLIMVIITDEILMEFINSYIGT